MLLTADKLVTMGYILPIHQASPSCSPFFAAQNVLVRFRAILALVIATAMPEMQGQAYLASGSGPYSRIWYSVSRGCLTLLCFKGLAKGLAGTES